MNQGITDSVQLKAAVRARIDADIEEKQLATMNEFNLEFQEKQLKEKTQSKKGNWKN